MQGFTGCNLYSVRFHAGVTRRSDMRWNSALTVHGIGTQKEIWNISKTGMPAGPYMDEGTRVQDNAYPAVPQRSAVFLTAKREEGRVEHGRSGKSRSQKRFRKRSGLRESYTAPGVCAARKTRRRRAVLKPF